MKTIMDICEKIIRGIVFCLETIFARIRWHGCLNVDGLFRKRIDTQIRILDDGKINIGKNVTFQRNVSLSAVDVGVMNLGDGVFFNRNCVVMCKKEISIGDRVLFGPGVTIYDHDHRFSEEGIQKGFNVGSVVIEKGCWIGANVTILRNTHIGEYSVVGAGSVIKGEIPAHSLVISDRKIKIIPINNK